jgi:hypothetical protein
MKNRPMYQVLLLKLESLLLNLESSALPVFAPYQQTQVAIVATVIYKFPEESVAQVDSS